MARSWMVTIGKTLDGAGRKKCCVPGLLLQVGCVMLAVMLVAPGAFAQGESEPAAPDSSSLAWEVTKKTVLDPTTYTPALLSYGATKLDWDSSQVFFRHGFVEQNPRFTVSGFSYDVPISHAAGNRRILKDTVGILSMSVVNNVTTNVLENILIKRYPDQRKLLRTLGWIERIGFASFWSYRLSADHLRKWQENERLARQFK